MPTHDDPAVAQRDNGATSIEYSLMAALIGVVCVVAITLLGLNVLGLFNLMPAGL
jgi:pilus assembly protein Flp/PilA